jgi:hypothetical protein
MKKKLMMLIWRGEEGTERLGKYWFQYEPKITVAMTTVAVMVKSWTMHNFLIQISNHACE